MKHKKEFAGWEGEELRGKGEESTVGPRNYESCGLVCSETSERFGVVRGAEWQEASVEG